MAEIDLGLVKGSNGKDSLYNYSIKGSSGYIEFSNGVKDCWGYDVIPPNTGYKDVTLPVTYTDNNFNPMVTGYQTNNNNVYIEYVTQNTIRVASNNKTDTVRFYYRVIGR